jgi:hypothetical protein
MIQNSVLIFPHQCFSYCTLTSLSFAVSGPTPAAPARRPLIARKLVTLLHHRPELHFNDHWSRRKRIRSLLIDANVSLPCALLIFSRSVCRDNSLSDLLWS